MSEIKYQINEHLDLYITVERETKVPFKGKMFIKFETVYDRSVSGPTERRVQYQFWANDDQAREFVELILSEMLTKAQ